MAILNDLIVNGSARFVGGISGIQVGERNLILNSGTPRTSTDYLVAEYALSEDWVVGEIYTLIFKGQHNSSYFGFYRDLGCTCIGAKSTNSASNYIESITFTCPVIHESGGTSNRVLQVYNMPDIESRDSSIEWIKLIKGNVVPVDWTPAPEDSVVGKCGTGTNAEIFNDYTNNKASGSYSHAEGNGTTAKGSYSHTEGSSTTASGTNSHAEGYRTIASGGYSHAEGYETTAGGGYGSHAEGYYTNASSNYSHAEGYKTSARGYATSAHGANTIAQGYIQAVFGKYNTLYAGASAITSTDGSIFIVGVGTSDTARKNAFRITNSGQCVGSTSFSVSGADYAEYYEWEDGNPNNEDRRGLFVTFSEGKKIRIANSEDDYILGVISADPSVIGNAYTDSWQGMHLTDVFGERLTEIVEVEEEEILDEEGNVIETIPAHTETRFILNPDYDSEKEYIGRNERQEWATVGTHGQLVVIDDGSCQVNKYCKVSDDGIAIHSDEKTEYRIVERLDDTHIRIVIK